MLIPDGVYLADTDPPYLRAVSAPTSAELQVLVQRISERIGRLLERKGLLVRDVVSSHLAFDPGGEAQGHIRYALQTPYRDGTTHVIFEPLDFLARLAALVPSPGVNLTRYHGVFAANHRLRAQIVAAKRGRGGSRAGQCGAKAPRDDLGAAPQTGLRHRD
jgi:hypothetical protein